MVYNKVLITIFRKFNESNKSYSKKLHIFFNTYYLIFKILFPFVILCFDLFSFIYCEYKLLLIYIFSIICFMLIIVIMFINLLCTCYSYGVGLGLCPMQNILPILNETYGDVTNVFFRTVTCDSNSNDDDN